MDFRMTRENIATFGGVPLVAAEACQRALANRKEMHEHLAYNPDLTVAIWKRLWGNTRPPAGMAKNLVSRNLTKDLRLLVIRQENRVGVLNLLISHNTLDRDEQLLLMEKGNVGETLMKQDWLDEDLRKPVAIQTGGVTLLRELALSPIDRFTEEETQKLLKDHAEWAGFLSKPSSSTARLMRIMFGRRPAAGEGLLQSAEPRAEMLTALAGSANLTAAQAETIADIRDGVCYLSETETETLRFCLMALVANPRCPASVVKALEDAFPLGHDVRQGAKRREGREGIEGPYADVSDSETLDWLIGRSCPSQSEYGYRQGRPIELLALLRNTHLNNEQRKRVTDGVQRDVEPEILRNDAGDIEGLVIREAHTVATHHRELPEWYVNAMTFAAQRLGPDLQRWETLIGLLEDYEGSFEELVDLAESI